MTKGQCREIVRRRLNERTADDLEDAEIHGLINEALKFVQKLVLKVNAYAFLGIKTVDTVAGTAGEFYELPNDLWYILEVGYKSSASSSYARTARGNYHSLRESSTSSTPGYDLMGQYLALWPNPTVAVSAGLRILYVPTLTIGNDDDVDNDSVALPIHPALHMAVAIRATMYALGETMESRTELAQEFISETADIPEWYHRGGEPQQIRADTGKKVY